MIRREFLRRGSLWVAAGAITPAILDRLDWAAHRIYALGPLYRARVTLYGWRGTPWVASEPWREVHVVPVEVGDGGLRLPDIQKQIVEAGSLEGVTVELPGVSLSTLHLHPVHTPRSLTAGSELTIRFGQPTSVLLP